MHIRLLLAACLLVAVPAQTVHVVQGGGGALQSVVLAAAPGDILDVMPGAYSAITVTRGLRILLRSGVTINTATSGQPVPAITISGVPVGEGLVIAGPGIVYGVGANGCAGGLSFAGIELGFSNFGGVSTIASCTGPVSWQDVTGGAGYLTLTRIEIVNCGQVSFRRGVLPSIRVTNSNVTLSDVTVPKHSTSAGLYLVSGSVSIAGGHLSGGQFFSVGLDMPGIWMDQGQLTVTGGARIEAETYWSAYGYMHVVPAIWAAAGTVILDPSAVLIRWASWPGVAGGATVVNTMVPSLVFARQAPSANYQLLIAAEPSSFVFTLLGLPDPVLTLPWGDAWLSPMSAVVNLAQMPASGSSVYSSSLNGVPPFLTIVAQSAALTPAGSVVLGVPVRFLWD